MYTSEICPYVAVGRGQDCPMGDQCFRAHNRVEEFYHPEKYKVKFCSSYPGKLDSCEYGELTVDLLHLMEPKDTDFYMFHFKTIWCPYSDTNHPRDSCVYAHNW
jgi:hypothetical protein